MHVVHMFMNTDTLVHIGQYAILIKNVACFIPCQMQQLLCGSHAQQNFIKHDQLVTLVCSRCFNTTLVQGKRMASPSANSRCAGIVGEPAVDQASLVHSEGGHDASSRAYHLSSGQVHAIFHR